MKKSLIALAVAGVVAAPAFAATSNVDVYGQIRMSVDHLNSATANTDKWSVNDQTSRIGFKGSEDLGGGLKAIWQIEQQINATNGPLDNALNSATVKTAGGSAVTGVNDGAFGNAGLRNTFVGLAGGFGTVIVGRHDTPYKLGGSADLFGDTSADAQKNGSGIIGRNGFDNRVSGTIAYISPTFSGFHFAVATVPGEGATGATTARGLSDAVSMVAVYENGPLKATLGHESFGKKLVAGADNAKATKLNVAYGFGDIKLGYTYERSDDGFAANSETDTAQLASLAYAMGPITLAAQYGKFNNKGANSTGAGGILGFAKNDDDLSRFTLGAIYNLSKRTNVYAAYNSDNASANADAKVITMGVNHSF
jgi:predicted porin